MSTKKKKSNKKSSNNKVTHIAFVVDRSGSMSSIHKQTVDGINEQFAALRKANTKDSGEVNVSILQFDDVVETIVDSVKPSELKEWSMLDFNPRGSTAMYDGIWNAINHLKAKKETDDTAYLVCVISDGGENASREITQPVMTAEIKKLQNKGNWTFQYLLSGVDIEAYKHTLAATNGNIAYYNASTNGSATAFTTNAASTANYVGLRSATIGSTMNTSYTAFSDEDIKKLVQTK